MTICSKNFGGHGPVVPPGYAYAGGWTWRYNSFKLVYIFIQRSYVTMQQGEIIWNQLINMAHKVGMCSILWER